jgi:cobaltochelatase CobN
MHLLTTSSVGLDDIVEAVDLGQPPGDIAVLSFADSDLSGLAAAWDAERSNLPTLRLAHLRDLRHPMSVDLWIDRVGANAKVILIRLLGGMDFWRYGIERLSALARERRIALAVLPGEDREDERLAAASTLSPHDLAMLLRFFREGGRNNLRGLLRQLARHAGHEVPAREPAAVPRFAGYLPGDGAVALDRLIAAVGKERPVVPIVFYRAMVLAGDTAPIDGPCAGAAGRHQLERPRRRRLLAPGFRTAQSGADRHHDGLCRRRRRQRNDGARGNRRTRLAGRQRHHQACCLARQPARA